jgi:hypothetical protein
MSSPSNSGFQLARNERIVLSIFDRGRALRSVTF